MHYFDLTCIFIAAMGCISTTAMFFAALKFYGNIANKGYKSIKNIIDAIEKDKE